LLDPPYLWFKNADPPSHKNLNGSHFGHAKTEAPINWYTQLLQLDLVTE